jgi:hypothetical protein
MECSTDPSHRVSDEILESQAVSTFGLKDVHTTFPVKCRTQTGTEVSVCDRCIDSINENFFNDIRVFE